MTYLPYAGIGARKTPGKALGQMQTLGAHFHDLGFTLRSGAADGADTAFEMGAGTHKEIYLPWVGFNDSGSSLDLGSLVKANPALDRQLEDLFRQFHPYWYKVSHGAEKLLKRNAFQVLGKDLVSPSKFVVCWTEGGKKLGGTGQAIRIAQYYDIPVFDLFHENAFVEAMNYAANISLVK